MKIKLLFVLPLMTVLVACSNQGTSGGNQSQGQSNIYHGRGVPSDSLGDNYNHYYDE